MEKTLQTFIMDNIEKLSISKEGTDYVCTLNGKKFTIASDGVVVIKKEEFMLSKGESIYKHIHSLYREKLIRDFMSVDK